MAMDPFPGLPDEARLWVIAIGEGAAGIEEGLADILGRWRHKGQSYEAAWEVLEDRIVLVAEPHMAGDPSGCAIDGMLRKVQRLAESLGRKAIGEDRVLARVDGRLRDFGREELSDRLADGTLTAATPVLDRSLHHLGQLRQGRLERPLAATWIGRKHGVAAGA